MNTYEALLEEARESGLSVIHYPFQNNRIKGLYCNNTAAINSSIDTSIEKSCILAEELGHHYTSSGDIIDLSNAESRKQEYKARLWAYNYMIGLTGIIAAHTSGCTSLYDTAEFLDVTVDFLMEAISQYRKKYGTYVVVENYVIYFEPSVGVFELIRSIPLQP